MPAVLAPPPITHPMLDGRRSPYAHVPTVPAHRPAAADVPVVEALKSRAAQVADAELGRLASRAPGLDASARDEVRQSIQRVVDAFLHEPIARVTRHADSPLGETYADALTKLFSLDHTAGSRR